MFSLLPVPLYALSVFLRPLLYAAFGLQAVYLAIRGFETGRMPIVGVHDTLSLLSASLVAFSFPLLKAVGRRRDFFVMLSLTAAMFSLFAFFSKPHAGPLPPVLKTYWFELHVVLSFFSYALFGLGAILGVCYLRAPGDSQGLLGAQYRSLLVGYGFFSLSMVFGGIWAYLAWGTYWVWTPKEIWTTLLWLFYGLYLHARLMGKWAGRPSAALGAAGFLVVLFTYLGVGLLMKSSHAF